MQDGNSLAVGFIDLRLALWAAPQRPGRLIAGLSGGEHVEEVVIHQQHILGLYAFSPPDEGKGLDFCSLVSIDALRWHAEARRIEHRTHRGPISGRDNIERQGTPGEDLGNPRIDVVGGEPFSSSCSPDLLAVGCDFSGKGFHLCLWDPAIDGLEVLLILNGWHIFQERNEKVAQMPCIGPQPSKTLDKGCWKSLDGLQAETGGRAVMRTVPGDQETLGEAVTDHPFKVQTYHLRHGIPSSMGSGLLPAFWCAGSSLSRRHNDARGALPGGLQHSTHEGFNPGVVGTGNDVVVDHHRGIDHLRSRIDHIIHHPHIGAGPPIAHDASRNHNPGTMTQPRDDVPRFGHSFDKGEGAPVLPHTIRRFMASGTDHDIISTGIKVGKRDERTGRFVQWQRHAIFPMHRLTVPCGNIYLPALFAGDPIVTVHHIMILEPRTGQNHSATHVLFPSPFLSLPSDRLFADPLQPSPEGSVSIITRYQFSASTCPAPMAAPTTTWISCRMACRASKTMAKWRSRSFASVKSASPRHTANW